MGPDILERLLGEPGVPHGIGARIGELLNGNDSSDVGQVRNVPTQIRIEDSYMRLDTLTQVTNDLRMLATSLLTRMYANLLESEIQAEQTAMPPKRWLAHPKTIRLTTRPRPRPAQNPDGSRNHSFARRSRCAPMPSFVFDFKDTAEAIVERQTGAIFLRRE
ncbi:hypothetical protein ACEQ8H_003906 [Pleosporales sp. CAS-2024a]